MRGLWAGGALALVGTVAAGAALAQQKPAAPVATYWVTADTVSGGAGGFGGVTGLLGGGGASADVTRTLILQLASRRALEGAPSAEHLPPPGLKAGARLPLVTPKAAPVEVGAGEAGVPKGRVLVYWGCGVQARAGQPKVIDLAKPAAGAAFASDLGALAQSPPSPGPGRVYGEWPNARSAGRTPAGGSLVGEHVVRGDYTPEIRFTLGAGQDFLPPLKLAGPGQNAAGAVPLSWGTVTGAQGYFASVVGATEQGDTVIWSSSEIPLLAGQLPDHLGPAALKRMIARGAVMGPQATRCAVPAQVATAAPAALLRLVAYGAEADFVYPPRPADPKAAWKPEYAVKVRYASTTSAVLGLSDAPDEADEADEAEAVPTTGKRARTLLRGLGAIAL